MLPISVGSREEDSNFSSNDNSIEHFDVIIIGSGPAGYTDFYLYLSSKIKNTDNYR